MLLLLLLLRLLLLLMLLMLLLLDDESGLSGSGGGGVVVVRGNISLDNGEMCLKELVVVGLLCVLIDQSHRRHVFCIHC